MSVVTRLRSKRSGVLIPAEKRNLCLSQKVQTNSAAHPASYLTGTGSFSPGREAAGTLS